MGRYEALKGTEAFKELTPASADSVSQLRSSLPGMPEDYADFLLDAGYGEAAGLMLYSGLVPPDEILGPASASLGALQFFGDDFQGYSFGFDTARGWRVVEVDSSDRSVHPVAASFEEFITEWVEG